MTKGYFYCRAFFGSLYRCLARGAKAVLQVYPKNLSQRQLIVSLAIPLDEQGEASKEDDSSIWLARRVPMVMPISAAMAICALHLLLRYGEKSDGLVTCRDAEVPGSVVIRLDKKLDHGWMVHSSWKKNPDEPDACEM
ncbi:hypothetical protein Nepgr_010560 [Nepenthes gracilis]|uniref:Uncharacterized protein n=1 Tax=Nepenthes gracilis TaxID=150966 RepID=A0AAD3SCK3_NEPGR|nr:hypothetical protein Nepgr_010560 [Nepenthes gracilis]